jgi:hypothetical protein
MQRRAFVAGGAGAVRIEPIINVPGHRPAGVNALSVRDAAAEFGGRIPNSPHRGEVKRGSLNLKEAA